MEDLIRKIWHKNAEIINLSKDNMDVSFLVDNKDERQWAYITKELDYETLSQAIDQHRRCNILIHRFRLTNDDKDKKGKHYELQDRIAWASFSD